MSFLFFTLALIVSYTFIGGCVKLLDQLVDQPNQMKKRRIFPWILTLGLSIIISTWVLFDLFTAILVLALLLGLIGARKVDNIYFLVLTIATFPFSLVSILLFAVPLFLIPTFIALIPSVILDELLHSVATKTSQPLVHWFLAHRPVLKIVVLILPFFGLLLFVHSVAFWCFDISYDLVAYYHRALSNTNH